jgi:hypothetical protein
MAVALAALPTSPICGIGTFPVDSSTVDFEIGWDELERDAEWTHSLLVEAGLRKGDLVLFSTATHEGPWVMPIVRALRRIGAPYATSETYGWDSRRYAMYLRRLPVKAVVGLGAETVAALDSQGTLSTLLSGVDVVWARSDALPPLKAQRIEAAPFLPLGPALGLGMPGERGARVNENEWTVEEIQGRVHITNKRPRATSFDAADTGVSGLVEASDGDFVVFPRSAGSAEGDVS